MTSSFRLYRLADQLRDAMAKHKPCDDEERIAIARERGWLEALSNLSQNGGLNYVGMLEGENMLTASREWFEGLGGQVDGPSL